MGLACPPHTGHGRHRTGCPPRPPPPSRLSPVHREDRGKRSTDMAERREDRACPWLHARPANLFCSAAAAARQGPDRDRRLYLRAGGRRVHPVRDGQWACSPARGGRSPRGRRRREVSRRRGAGRAKLAQGPDATPARPAPPRTLLPCPTAGARPRPGVVGRRGAWRPARSTTGDHGRGHWRVQYRHAPDGHFAASTPSSSAPKLDAAGPLTA
ncbi:hypothetical protein HBB16_19220 [Pseudonocardia sp. MCCB 268]|nr:hypothetical protein [Pseudonocardia cytotoxica]